ncbi:MAG: chromosome segregation protein SMC [Gammaproteobacteria bacterium HGW-Gammaproteobacteria-3]|nr:MAG: chromosome segregation protein SMC [Gammaproteobacteria bacterium HGW-Gammaproteobacteria-3]
MRLEKIKLSGFKSFVDTTSIPISGNLTAIVGPNGCGKSNIIDAVRWVMGESSAKHLRGANMADVIFNGSSSRKPVGTASVELVFDNSEGKAGGEYAQYNTISIKRQVSRDGQSVYLLNNARCRRKDITDLFLGTGLGSRSYAIIEQGTISRMVEAKPDELRIHIEEAAGISKYKERRQETETRMLHTRENLERLDDLRDEVGKQLRHLQKQAEKAEQYTELKKQERQYKLELLAMRWNGYHQASQQLDARLQAVADEHNRLFVVLRELDAAIEHKRGEHKDQQALLNKTQARYYHISAQISRLEQTITLNQKSHGETLEEIGRLTRQLQESADELEDDRIKLEETVQTLAETEAIAALTQERETEAIQAQQALGLQRADWQQQWEAYLSTSASHNEQVQIQQVKISQLESRNRQLHSRLDKLNAERASLSGASLQSTIEALNDAIETLEQQRAEAHRHLENVHEAIQTQRLQSKAFNQTLHTRRAELHNSKGKITSLEMLQQHAMGQDNKHLNAWLQQMHLSGQPRLAQMLEVDKGWERAVETVLGTYLEAVCIDHVDGLIPALQQLGEDSLTLFETGAFAIGENNSTLTTLLGKVKAPWSLAGLLTGIYCADSLNEARALQARLQPYESIILPDGVWLGAGWLRIIRSKDSKTGVLQREKELRLLKAHKDEIQLEISELEEQLESAEQTLKNAEAQRESLQLEDKTLGSELSLKKSEASAHSARHEQQQQRLAQICNELDDIFGETEEIAQIRTEAEYQHEQAEHALTELMVRKDELEAAKQNLQTQAHASETAVAEVRRQLAGYKARIESLRSTQTLTAKQIERQAMQHRQTRERIMELEKKREDTARPLDNEKQALEQSHIEKEQLETELKQARQTVTETEKALTRLTEEQFRSQRAIDQQKEQLDKIRFEQQEGVVRQLTITEQLQEIGADPEPVLKNLSRDANEDDWKNHREKLALQIDKLGAINLSAIEEYQSQSERMKFLDDQHADLIEAMATLSQAISKIDKESKQRFKETFDKINTGLQEKFPKLFGGGQAYLELTGQDLLDTGVNIVARPPGKRNSSIHLLSGGEKALTAVALVFSIFELNPAPFCLLDEVDAPLDDANVGRFSQMVEEMSESVQFLFISHNKATMEIAKQLAGVTMKEPGVSRMVAVDIEAAVSLVEN